MLVVLFMRIPSALGRLIATKSKQMAIIDEEALIGVGYCELLVGGRTKVLAYLIFIIYYILPGLCLHNSTIKIIIN